MPVPTGTLSWVRWDFARDGVFYTLEAITSPGPGTTDSAGAPLEKVTGVTLGKAQEAGEGQAEQSQGQGDLLFTGKQQIPGSSWSLGKTICFLLSSLGQGLQKEPRLPSVKETIQGTPAVQAAQLHDLPPVHRALAVSPVPLGESLPLENTGD